MKLSQIAIETTCFKKVCPDLMYEAVSKTGVKKLEFYAGAPLFCHYESLPVTAEELKEMTDHVSVKLAEYGMTIAALAPQSTDYEINIASDVDTIREKSIRYFIGYLNDLKALGCDRMTMTTGWGYYDQDVAPAWERAVDSVKKIATEAEKLGVTILLRPVWKFGTNIVNDIPSMKKMIEEVDCPAVKISLDIGGLDEGESITDYFKTFGKDMIGYVRFSNFTATGQITDGSGVEGAKAVFDELDANGYEGDAGLEMNYEHTEDPAKYIADAVANLKTICE